MPPKRTTKNGKRFSDRKRKKLTVGQKLEVLKYFNETNCSVRKLATFFNIGKTQAGQIVKQEESLLNLSLFENLYDTNCKLRPGSGGFEVDRIVYGWYTQQRNKNTTIVTGTMIQNKALEFSKEIGYSEFKASNGWLSRFLKRHKISLESANKPEMQGISEVSDFELTEDGDFHVSQEWKKYVTDLVSTFSADDIFSVVQIGLFYKAIPSTNNTWQLSGETCSNGKLSEERFTVLFCVSMSGKKEKPLVIANITQSEIIKLKNSEADCMPDEKAWVTQDIISKWLKEVDSKMGKNNRNILLFMDHAIPGSDCQFKNIQLVNLPPFSSSEYQPFNRRIIQDFKIMYRQHLLNHLIELKDNDDNGILPEKPISESQAINWICTAWKELSEYVIQKNFEELGLDSSVKDAISSANETSASLNDVSNLLCAFDSDVSAVDYVSIDTYLVTGDTSESVEILLDEGDMKHIIMNYKERMETGCKQDLEITSYSEALQCIKELDQFYTAKNDQTCTLLISQLITYNNKQ